MASEAERLRVSVAMATCQGSAHIDDQLASLAEQQRPPDELVVCDDASEDDTVERVRSFAGRAPFEVRLERNSRRLGTTANFGRAVSLCTGEVIFFADQDDHWLPEKIRVQAGVLEQDPRIGAVLSDGRVVDDARNPLGYGLWDAVGFDAREQAEVRAGRATAVFFRHVVAAGTTLAFRASFRPLLLPFPNLRSAHDAWVAFMIAAVSDFALIDQPLIEYRLHGENQFGLRRLGLFDQLAKARQQVAEQAFLYAELFFEAARRRLQAQSAPEWRADDALAAELAAKIEHSRWRQALSPHMPARILPVLREAAAGNYARFGYGWKSVAQDLLLR